MKTIKKPVLGLIFGVAILFLLGLIHKASAATSLSPNFASCVVSILDGGGTKMNTNGTTAGGGKGGGITTFPSASDYCQVDSGNGANVTRYSGLENVDLRAANYKTSTDTVTATSSSNGKTVTIKLPKSIEILDEKNKPIFSNLKTEASYGTLEMIPKNGSNPINTDTYFPNSHVFEIYTPTGVGGFSFLTQVNGDGTLQILALVSNTIQNGKYVYAASINKASEGSSAAGAPTSGGSASCTISDSSVSTSCDAAGTTDPAATQTTCEANANGFSFAWAVCPMLDAASKLSDTLLGYFEDQLSFSVAQLGTAGSQVQHSWSLIKDICSALLVLIMLAMVLSQAVSIGPFDAYTIRKLLPRLIVVVILMQISWNLFAYVITIVNHIAQGLADIMYLPFGGSNNMGLFNLLGHANLGGVELGVLNWAAIGVGIALGIAFLFTMLGVAFTAIVALLFALLTLVFRKILIIVLLIFSPLALLAWVLPGTERYWKMWRENFFKVLFMYPLLVAIIAAGRVFAYIVGSQNNGEFLNLIFILVGFFGPLFLAPRTFKWGGQAMQMAGSGIMKASSKVSERPKKYFDKRQEEYNAQKRISAAGRLRQWDQGKLSTTQKLGSVLRGDKFKSGDWDPAYVLSPVGRKEMKRQREENMLKFRAASTRAENEEREYAAQRLEEEASHTYPGNEDQYYKEVWEGKRGHRSQAERYAALEKIADIGGEGNLEYVQNAAFTAAATSDNDEKAAFARFSSRKAGVLFSKLPHLPQYKGIDRAAGGLKPEDVTNLSATATRTMLADLQPRAAAGDTSAQQALDHLYSAYQLAASSEATNRRISFDVRDAIEGSLRHPAVPSGVATSVRNASSRIQTGATVPSPADIKTQHTETWRASLPDLTALSDPAQRQAYKIRLMTDPGAVEVLARGIAYETDPAEISEHNRVLSEMEAAARSGTDEQKKSFNSIIDQIQKAYSQRADDIAQHTGATGGDATAIGAARQAEFGAAAPQIAKYEGMRIL